MRSLIPWIFVFVISSTVTTVRSQSNDGLRFKAETLGGQMLTQDAFKKSALILSFWGTWSAPSRDAARHLQELYGKYKHHGLEVVGIAVETGKNDRENAVRDFASKHGLSYPIALANPALKRLVSGGLSTYPTLLFYKAGLEYSEVRVGFEPSKSPDIENWVRAAVGMKPLETPEVQPDSEAVPAVAQPGNSDEASLPEFPAGVIFTPEDGNRGFEFEVTDVDGNHLKFTKLRGKPVVLAISSSWIEQAEKVGAAMQSLHDTFGERAHVLAASLELERIETAKAAKIRAFRTKHGLKYPMFPAGIGFQKKIHQFKGMPLFLVFDSEGLLVHRESLDDVDANAEDPIDAIRANIEDCVNRHAAK